MTNMASKAAKLIAAVFEGVDSAESALNDIRGAIQENQFKIEAALAMSKDQHGGVHYKDVGLTPAKGTLGGLVLGGVVGLLTGGTALVLGAVGGLVGGVVGRKKRDSRFDPVQVNQVLAAIMPGSSALLIVVEDKHLDALQGVLDGLGAEVFVASVSQEMVEALKEYHDEAYSALDSYLDKPS